MNDITHRSNLPSVDRLLRDPTVSPMIEEHGRPAVTDAVREVLASARGKMAEGAFGEADLAALPRLIAERLERSARPSLRRVFNLTGTVLHTNLGRAPLPREAIEAMTSAAAACSVEFDLETGKRGDRDDHVAPLICRLTGAEAATVVNNNAAAVLLLLDTLAAGREVPVSRGDLIESGGSVRVLAFVSRAGCTLREVGTTTRTQLRDFAGAIGPETALLMNVHASNFAIEGFTAAVSDRELANLAREHRIPYVVDLGSGQLVDLRRFGLPHEPTPQEAIAAGADLVTFSGDKLLGGPQAGVIAGRADLVERIRKNPMKRAMRIDKVTIAALAAVLRLYLDPERLPERLPTLRLLTRPKAEIVAQARRLHERVAKCLKGLASVEVIECMSQIGSGSLPVDLLPSAALALRPEGEASAERLAGMLRALPVPVVGRIKEGRLLLDLRCMEDEEEFLEQLSVVPLGKGAA